MAKGFSPLIGLAVVVALAMVAVFGALSLNNATPVFAQDATQTVHVGETVNVDITSLITGGGANYDTDGTATVTVQSATTDLLTATAPTVVATFGGIVVSMTGEAEGTGRVTVSLPLVDSDTPQRLRIDVTVIAATPPTLVGVITDLAVAEAVEADTTVTPNIDAAAGTAKKLDVSGYFADGKGTGGKVVEYSIGSDTAATVVVSADDGTPTYSATETSTDGKILLRAPIGGQASASAIITVTARVTAGSDTGGVSQTFFVDVVDPGSGTAAERATLTPDSMDPGKNTRYRLVFNANSDIRSGIEDITIELDSFSVPSSIDASSVSVSATGDHDNDVTTAERVVTNSPADVAVNGEKITLTLKTQADDFLDVIDSGDVVTIVIRQSAGVSNPAAGGKYGAPAGEEADEDMFVTIDGADDLLINEITVLRTVGLDPDDGGRGDMVTATAEGFRKSTTVHFFLDENGDGMRDIEEFDLCTATVGGNSIGSCEFEVTRPPFGSGENVVNAVDGRNQYASMGESDTFTLDPSLSATPKGGTPGEIILVQLADFTNSNVSRVRLARRDLCNDANTDPDDDVEVCTESISSTGDLNFRVTIPDWAPDGKQDFRVDVGDEDASTTLDITGPIITPTPRTVAANQRVSLVGDGFNNGSLISEISIGGEVIESARINAGQPVRVDNGGGWSAAVNLPLSASTTSVGSREIRVTDSEGRSGIVSVNIPAREVTITPAVGRVGTLATVRGVNFPSKNDDGSSFNVTIEYDTGDGETTVSAVPDASGRFEVQMRIPTSADIPSTNTVKVSFDTELADGRDGGPTIVTTVTHAVPEGIITLSTPTGPPGTLVNISGQGFKAYVPVQSVSVGSIEVTPSPAPSTDVNGMMNFNIVIPGLDNGIQTIEVEVSGTTASLGFTVSPSGVSAGNITESSLAVENMGDNFVRSFNFNNDTKSWTFYSPEAPDASTQTNFITGESYWILINESQEVILNGKTRNLTCAADSCWNNIVW